MKNGICSIRISTFISIFIGLILVPGLLFAQPCEVPDNGGTAVFPPLCFYGYQSPDDIPIIIDGLPPGTTVLGKITIRNFINITSGPGGLLGGRYQTWDASATFDIYGTGSLAGYSRSLPMTVSGVTHTAPRTPGDTVQEFAADMFELTGSIFGDPDFDTFTLAAGTNYGLPSPGSTTLVQQPSSDFAVDSFFDITYQVSFVGAPGSVMEGFAGTTTNTERFTMGEPVDLIACDVPDNGGTPVFPPLCPAGYRSPPDATIIIDGLPPGDTIQGRITIQDFSNFSSGFGGGLGGRYQNWDCNIVFNMTGTGGLAGYSRNITVPVFSGETQTAPRTPGDPVQDFATDMYEIYGTIIGDPDFASLAFTGGSNNGLAGPGNTVFVRQPNTDFAVDSFFDITYQIDFTGAPGSILDGLSGSTIASDYFIMGTPMPLEIDEWSLY